MSVVLDALRRARGSAPGRRPPTRSGDVPAGLRVGTAGKAARTSKEDRTRWGLIGGVVGGAVLVFIAVQFALPMLQRRASAPRVVAITAENRGALPQSAAPAPALSESAVPAPQPSTTPGAPAANPTGPPETAPTPNPIETASTPSMTQMIDKIAVPPAVAPRAMPNARRLSATAASAATGIVRPPAPAAPLAAAGPPAPRSAPPPPVPAAPPVASATPAPATPPAPATADTNHFELALRYQSLGNFEQALAHYSALLQTQEFNVEARNNLGLLYLDRGLSSEAIEQFRRAIVINPQYVKARSNLGVALMNAGRLDEARAELRAALAIAPRNVEVLVNMALVEKSAGLVEQAKELLLKALSYQPTHAAAHYNLAVLLDEAGNTAQAYDHYSDFLSNAGPEFGGRLADVRRRLDTIAPRLDAVR